MKKLKLLSIMTLLAIPFLSGCEKVANSAKNIQSDWMGLDRKVEIYGCLNGNPVRTYIGDVRLNEEDGIEGTSLLIDGKKMNISSRSCYIITEIGIAESTPDSLSLK